MKINGLNSQSISINYNNYKNSYTNEVKNVKSVKDVVEISDVGRLMKNYSSKDLNLRDESMISEIKNQIKSGTYSIDSRLTAKSILESMSGI